MFPLSGLVPRPPLVPLLPPSFGEEMYTNRDIIRGIMWKCREIERWRWRGEWKAWC